MSKILCGILVGLVLGGAITWTLFLHPQEKKTEAGHQEEPHVLHSNGQIFVKLDKESQQHMGLKTVLLEAATLPTEVKAYGRVLDPTPLTTQVVAIAGAQVALETSLKEFQRLKRLHEQDQNVSSRALEIAEASAKRDQLAADTAQLALLAAWGKSIASQSDLPGFARSLASGDNALVRVEVPLGTVLKSSPTAGRIAAPATEDSPLDAQWLGPAPSVDPQTQGQGFLLLLKKSPWPLGAAVKAWLTLPGEEAKGVMVPRAAVVRHEAEAFVYVPSGDELFARKKIKLEHPTAQGWFVEQELQPGQSVVIVGAQQLLSRELQGGNDE